MTLAITNADASANILRFADEGRLTQSIWHGKASDGRDIACLLGAIHPSVTSSDECNGSLMPMWLAELTPVLFDGIPAAKIVPIAQRYGGLVARWDKLTPEAWNCVLRRFLVRTIDEAIDAARPCAEGKPYWPAIEAAYVQTKAALESGDKKALAAARAAARAAAEAAAEAAAARAAARAAEAAAAAVYLRIFTFLLDLIEAECAPS